ncbi:MAG TPA: PAS domain S-box protein, partial [Thermoanaerobaculia bacterium]|nr:PAS domain S-box protein [Thermoanaerobaculia bacterium]
MPQHIRILLVEDNPRDAELIERELRRGSLDVSTERVHDESALRSALDSMDPDVILCDYNLPGFDGIEALKIASELVPDIPLIFVSGSIGEERAVQTLREGAVDYVLKDRLSRLPSAITRALDQRRERQLRRRAQEALQRSEERFQYAAKATQDVIWDWNVLTDKIWFNEALRTVWGYQLEPDYVSSEWRESLIHPQDRERVRSAFRAALASHERLSDEYRFQRSGGRYGEVMESSLFIRDAKGRAVRVISAMIDLSERAAAEETIRRLNHQNQMILNSAAEAIVGVDRQGKVNFINPAAMRMTGFAPAEFLESRSMHELIHYARADASEYPRELCPLMTSVSAGTSGTAEDTFFRKTGEPFPVEYSCSPILENGEIAGSVIIFQDITARKRLEKKIQQTERVASLGRVAATIAHEFNNVLMGIQPFAEIVRRNAKEEK